MTGHRTRRVFRIVAPAATVLVATTWPLLPFIDPVGLFIAGMVLAEGLTILIYAMSSRRRQRRLKRLGLTLVAAASAGMGAVAIDAVRHVIAQEARCRAIQAALVLPTARTVDADAFTVLRCRIRE